MSRVFVGIGSNEGDRLEHLSRAIQALGSTPGISVTQMATIYDTEPLGPPQPEYLNTVVELDTTRSPQQLLDALQLLERQLGRLPSAQRWGPRVIDLDILLYDDRILNEPTLVIPHPRLHERRFVLEPLAQLAPTLVHPVLRKTVEELLANLPVEQSLGSG
ncbi:MAG: 2-amino-4-hydroxy-6-hydroxymethyldihydropteridine diphosphokinase [Candidatus Omnitrophica bacterium]|nr:2-amino-4-hydroxy-6-hydroxymethyldihydropteridine diphosphokinase [Candidatus Omnitrophota bacterium]